MSLRQTDFGKSIRRSPNNIVSGVVRCAESSRGARLSSSLPDLDEFVERGPTIMSPPRLARMPVEDRNFPAARFRPAFEQVNYKCFQHACRTFICIRTPIPRRVMSIRRSIFAMVMYGSFVLLERARPIKSTFWVPLTAFNSPTSQPVAN